MRGGARHRPWFIEIKGKNHPPHRGEKKNATEADIMEFGGKRYRRQYPTVVWTDSFRRVTRR